MPIQTRLEILKFLLFTCAETKQAKIYAKINAINGNCTIGIKIPIRSQDINITNKVVGRKYDNLAEVSGYFFAK